ncbi:kama family protein [Xylariaceae sp. FL0255]|nr:kama family protein [Xylariaceae sp. FL0255]
MPLSPGHALRLPLRYFVRCSSAHGGWSQIRSICSGSSAAARHAETIATPPVTSAHEDPQQQNIQESEFWRSATPYRDVSRDEFLSWRWHTKNLVETPRKLYEFIDNAVPKELPKHASIGGVQTREEFEADVAGGIRRSTMSIRLMPYVMSRIDWTDPANDPIFRQFVPLRSVMKDDHPEQKLDSLHEQADSPVDGVVHRYPDKALFLRAVSVCPTYCTYCTRSYGVGANTDLVTKASFKLAKPRLKRAFDYIASQEGLKDIVVSGGDAYYLPPEVLEWIGDRLISMKNIERFRLASKGLAVAPSRFIDESDGWTRALIRISDKARLAGKQCALHTHFNHPNEISWVTTMACSKLARAGVTVRNQSVLLRGVNDSTETMSSLIRKLAQMLIQPYYVYQCDMVPEVEHLRTRLQTILDMESQLRGSIAGFYMPNFVVDLPGGGGKRLACSHESYDRESGVSTFRAPAVTGWGKDGKTYKYFDPLD